jgi:hypothetical protein
MKIKKDTKFNDSEEKTNFDESSSTFSIKLEKTKKETQPTKINQKRAAYRKQNTMPKRLTSCVEDQMIASDESFEYDEK